MGEGDHARPNTRRVLATPETLAIMKSRFGEEAGGSLQPLRYGETIRLGDVAVRLAPAGHVLGSAQIVLEHGGSLLVGPCDYKRPPHPLSAHLALHRHSGIVFLAPFWLNG